MTQQVQTTAAASPRLEAIESALAAAAQFDNSCPPQLAEAIRYALLAPGKRLRPQLVLMAHAACGGDEATAMPAAVAVEMIHAYSLVHDDLPAMDDDDLRRGRPTCHRQFDEATAILVGDALQALAFETLAAGLADPVIAARCCRELARAAGPGALVGGQADDLAAQFRHAGVERLQSIHERKTGALFRVSLRLGAIAAGGSDPQIAALDLYGRNLGLAFQVVDDLLDVSGDEQQVGKRLGKDRDRGKMTYPSLIGVAASRTKADELTTAAVGAVGVFGPAGGPLVELAEQLRRRIH
ncbi:MAG: polyprenyl synthetase family protein [Pirellulales bacterium]|nr:polyprenyl synthetase family protein [Pirellulales bacterium]